MSEDHCRQCGYQGPRITDCPYCSKTLCFDCENWHSCDCEHCDDEMDSTSVLSGLFWDDGRVRDE